VVERAVALGAIIVMGPMLVVRRQRARGLVGGGEIRWSWERLPTVEWLARSHLDRLRPTVRCGGHAGRCANALVAEHLTPLRFPHPTGSFDYKIRIIFLFFTI
jgi:hypothetical protein